MNFVAKYFRLLPAVVVVGTGLLALKGVDLARAAQAPASEYGDPDNSGLAPTDNGGAPMTRDFASDDAAASGSAAEVDVLSSLTRRRAELDARERALAMRENILSAGEGRVDQKIGALKTLQSQIQALLAQRDAKQDDQIKALIKAYGPDGMPAKKAAGIFNTMPDEVLIPIAKGMKPGDLGGILQMMNPDAAQKLTVKLASLLKLPDAAPSTVCPDPATLTPASTDITAPVTNPVVSLNPPMTTAALTNPTVTPLPLPPAPTPTAAPPPAPAPATPPKPQATPPKPQASTPPKPITPPAQHPAKPVTTPPAKPITAAAPPPAKPTTAAATPPAKPAAAPAVTPAPATTPPAKPSTQAAAAPTTPPASAPPTPLTPHGG